MASEILDTLNVVDYDQLSFPDKRTIFTIIIRKERSNEILEILYNEFSSFPEFRIIIKPIEAYLPYPEEDTNSKTSAFNIKNEMISREEIYLNVLDMTSLNIIFILMAILSSLVAAVGVLNNNVAVIIAAMIVAPLLGPGIGLSFGLAMGDKKLVFMALKTSIVGILIGFVIAVFLGIFLKVNPTIPSIITRTNVGQGGFVLALASGFAGALAVTTQLPSTLVGVMIGISLMPPLVTFGLLLGSGEHFLAWGALLIFLVNLVSIYFASLITFYKEDIRPLDPKKLKSAKIMTKRSIAIFFIILVILFLIDIYQTEIWSNYIQILLSIIPS